VCFLVALFSFYISRLIGTHTHPKKREKENMKERSPFLMMILTRTASKLVISPPGRQLQLRLCDSLSLSLSFSLVNNHSFKETKNKTTSVVPAALWSI
jgi:hypothetical protein